MIKPILFSAPMVQAILDGRKSMTRRIIRDTDGLHDEEVTQRKPRYQPGDILWVRETWCNINKTGIEPEYYYKADSIAAEDYDSTEWKWRPSIFMPREAARIWLRVTDVRCERVQEITKDDAWSEGVGSSDPFDYQEPDWYAENTPNTDYTISTFAGLWESLNAKRGYSWDSNPWVWVISFERCEKPQEVAP